LVVKNGSNTRSRTASVMPCPVSVITILTKGSRRARSPRSAATSAGKALHGTQVNDSVPPSGIASRELIAMLSSADSSWPASARQRRPCDGAVTSMRMR
jgi:hypothetical protein